MKSALWLSLGSNMGNRPQQLAECLKLLENHFGEPLGISCVFETEPWQVDHELPYLNLVVVFACSLSPLKALQITQHVEILMGRKDKGRLQPRTIDIDVIAMGAQVFHNEALDLPHPSMTLRRFVLAPLADVCPNWKHPISGIPALQLLEKCADKGSIQPFCTGDELIRLQQF
jgi:2-amino-4-hydroxy-6-hydroxymethyldihydropteridine diphosphokinase